jgi:hypothetical protein
VSRRPVRRQPADRPGGTPPGVGPAVSSAIRVRPLASSPAWGVPTRRGGRRGWGYGGWYGAPWYWTDDGYTVDYGGGAPVAAAGAPGGAVSGNGHHASGRWVRRGRHIVLYGV